MTWRVYSNVDAPLKKVFVKNTTSCQYEPIPFMRQGGKTQKLSSHVSTIMPDRLSKLTIEFQTFKH